MKIRTCAALLLAVGLPTAVFAVDFPEIEPNESKAQALANGAFVLSAGDSVSGNTTGSSTLTAGAASADTFLLKTTPAALGIYRHRMVITTGGTAGHIGTIRGLSASSAGAGTLDSILQTSSSSTAPGRMNQWYGFGKEEQLYYRVTGTASTTGNYTSTLSTDVITPTAFGTNPEAGSMTIQHDAATDTAYDRDMFLFDSNFNPIAGIDDSDTTALSANLTPGTYYIGYGRFNTAAGTTSGSSIIQGTYQTGGVLDFNDIVTSSSALNGTQPVTLNISHVAGTSSAADVAPLSSYAVSWFVFTVDPAVSPTNPTGVGAASPSTVANDGSGVTTLTVTVTPGVNPASTFDTTGSVTVDGSGLGLGTITLLDDGVGADLVAGDFVFTADATILNGTAGGAYVLPFTITDDQARNGGGNINLNVTTPPPACASGLATLSFAGVQSDGPVGDPDNSLVTGDFAVAGSVNQITLTGRFTASGGSFRSEARVQLTAPDGTIYAMTAPFAGAPGSGGDWDVLGEVFTLGGLEDGTGTWSFEFFESFNDAVVPDAVWVGVCFAADLTSTNPTASGVASPASAINDGTGSTTLSVTVTPGAEPLSTFLTTGSVTVDGSLIGAGTVTLLDDGVAPDLVAGDFIFTADAAVANGTAAGSTPLPFFVTDDQGRNAGGNIAFTVTTPPPACPAGLATLSFSNVQGDGAIGDPDNSIVTGDFAFAGQINVLRMSGRMFSNALFNTEARIRATAPDGSFVDLQPFPSGTQSSPRDLTSIDFNLPALENGTGTWTFEFFESFNDGATPDVVWSDVCFAIDQAPTAITATDTASGPVARDGVATSTLSVTVTPAFFPDSTGIAVVVDDSSVGGSGSLSLLDDGNFPDAVAGDNIFTGTTTVAYTTALGTATLPYLVTDAEGGNFAGSLNFTVSEATGACCTGSGCIVTTIGDCLDVQGGTFAGTGTACTAPTALSTDGAGAFEDISATGTLLATLALADDAGEVVALPFTFNFFGNDYTSIRVVTNGFASFTGTSNAFSNGPIPSAAVPNDALYPLWDDLDFDVTGAAYTQLLGTLGSDARFIIQWNTVGQYNVGLTPLDTNTFQVALFEDGSFEFRYANVSLETTVDTTTIGFENADGTIAFQSAETRETLNAAVPISFRANSTLGDTGVCGNGCPPCAADYDNNGGVDGGDLGAFFADFEAGETCADVDGNGGVDGGDLGFFFAVFEAGGC
jgi:hypothetical protein